MKKPKFNIDFLLNIWIYTWLFVPFIVSVIILIYRIIINKGEENMSGELWGFCGAIVTAIIALIGVIIGVSVKRPKKEDTNEIINKNDKIINQMGKKDNTTLFRDHEDIIKKIEKNLENENSLIFSSLQSMNKYIQKEEYKAKVIGDEDVFFDKLKNSRVKDKLHIENLREEIGNLLHEQTKLIEEKEILKTEKQTLENKIQKLQKDKDKVK